MIGGTNKKLSVALGVAVAGLAFGGQHSAFAADLGGGGLADLEERIAELEATTARKGNRKVSLTITGNVNHALFAWDDGHESNTYVVTNETNPTKIRFHGDAKISGDWKAGYVLELGVSTARQDRVNQNDDNSGTNANTVGTRHSALYLDSKTFGRFWVGHTSDATDGILEINLANTGHFASSNLGQSFGDGGGGFHLRANNGTLLTGVQLGDLVVNGWGGTPDSHRYNLVKYETPTFAGFKASASWGEDDIWNIGLRYSGEFGGFKVAGGIGYSEYTDGNTNGIRRGAVSAVNKKDVDVEEFVIGGSILHSQTGLFLSGSYGLDKDNNAKTAVGATAAQLALADDETTFYYIQAGLERKFIPLGATTLFGEYFSLERGLALNTNGEALNAAQVGTNTPGLGAGFNRIVASELSGWGLGVNQNLNGAIDVYISYRHVDVDVTLANGAGATGKAAVEDFDYVTAGANIKF